MKVRTCVAAIALFFCSFAFAQGNGHGHGNGNGANQNHTCQGGHNCNSGGSTGTGAGTGTGTNPVTVTDTNSNSNTANANNQNWLKNTVTNTTTSSSSSNSQIKNSGNSSSESSGVGIGLGGSSGASATGGSVKDSGNSSNTLGQQQGQTQQATGGSVNGSGNSGSYSGASDNGNGNGNGNGNSNGNNGNGSNNSTTDVAAPKIPVSAAFANAPASTTNCFKGYGAAGQAMNFGFSVGGGKVDKTCQQLEVARSFALSGSRKAYCKVMISTKQSHEAHVTMDDCLSGDSDSTASVSQPAQLVQPATQSRSLPVAALSASVVALSNEMSAEVKPADPTPTAPKRPLRKELLGICTFTAGSNASCDVHGVSEVNVSSACKRMLEAAREKLAANPGAVLRVVGNQNKSEGASGVIAAYRATKVREALIVQGVSPNQIVVENGTGQERTVEIFIE